MSQKAPDTLGNLLQQLKQGWGKVAPILRSQLVKLLAISIPALEKLDARLATKPDTKPESAAEGAEQSSSGANAARSQADKLLRSLIQSLENLRHQLETAPSDPTTATNQVAAPDPAAVLTPASEPATKLPLADQVRQELSIAWKFVREQLVPVILSFLTRVVEKIDPPLTKAYSAISEKVKATPAIVNNWEKLKASSFWQKTSTATAPALRAASEKLATIKVPDNVKPILEKRVASTTLIVALVLLILFKPTPASRLTAKAPKLPTAAPTTKTSDRLAPPERGDSPLSPDKIEISNIQAQVADVSKKYGEALIQSVQTNFKLGRLIVELTDAWYQLDPGQQDKLMAELLGRSQKLKFKKLLVSDASQHLIARSPMVGKEMVILKRES